MHNNKFGERGSELYKKVTAVLKEVKGKEYSQWANKIDWTWFETWHHEGRRARHGASMMAPDYVQWHGNYLVAKTFYTEYIPEIREVIAEGKQSDNPQAKKQAVELDAVLTKVLNSPDHRWFIGKENSAVKAERLRRLKEFEQRYEYK